MALEPSAPKITQATESGLLETDGLFAQFILCVNENGAQAFLCDTLDDVSRDLKSILEIESCEKAVEALALVQGKIESLRKILHPENLPPNAPEYLTFPKDYSQTMRVFFNVIETYKNYAGDSYTLQDYVRLKKDILSIDYKIEKITDYLQAHQEESRNTSS